MMRIPEFDQHTKSQFETEFYEQFSIPEHHSLLYLGVALYDSEIEEFLFPKPVYYGIPGISKELNDIFSYQLTNIKEKSLPYINNILLDKLPSEYSFLYLFQSDDSSSVLVLTPVCETPISLEQFFTLIDLTEKEIKTIEIHAKIISEYRTPSFFAFLPLRYERKIGASILMFLTIFGNYNDDIASKNLRENLILKLKRATYDILNKRLLTIVNSEEKHAVTSAASAIFSRNMSHNIGSHVIPRASLENIDKKICNLLKPYGKLSTDCNERFKMASLLKRELDDYIRQKADFLAEVTTEAASSSTAYVYRDVILPFFRNTILIDCLAANEGLRYTDWASSKLSFRVLISEKEHSPILFSASIVNSNPVQTFLLDENAFVLPYGMYLKVKKPLSTGGEGGPQWEELALQIVNEDKDVSISLPGALGRYALYGILENMIRNTAKHNLKRNEPLRFTLCLQDADASYYRLFIYDNISDPLDTRNGKALYQYIREQLDQDIIDETGKVRPAAWGLAEKVICGNFLAGSASFVNKPDGGAVVKVYAETPQHFGIPDESEDKRLIYEFKLLKARQVLFVGEGLSNLLGGEKNADDWLRAGMLVKTSWEEVDAFFAEYRSGLAAFQFVVIGQDALPEAEKRGAWRQRLPFRIIRIDPDAAREGIDPQNGDLVVHELFGEDSHYADAEALMHRVWSVWCRRWTNLHSVQDKQAVAGLVSVYLDNIGDAELAKVWEQAARHYNAYQKTPAVNAPVLLYAGLGPEKEIKAEESPPGKTNAVYFDRHENALKAKKIENDDAYIAFDKGSEDFNRVFQPRFPAKTGDVVSPYWSFPLELFEAGMLRVLVLDERLVERAMSTADSHDHTASKTYAWLMGRDKGIARMWHIAYGAQVLLATHILLPGMKNPFQETGESQDNAMQDSALHSASFSERYTEYQQSREAKEQASCPVLMLDLTEQDKMRLRLHRFGPDEQAGWQTLTSRDIDVIVVHQGILDVFKRYTDNDSKALLDALHHACPWVIVESGRGLPPEIQANQEKFLPFSALDRCFGANRIAKLSLTKRLMECTRNQGGR